MRPVLFGEGSSSGCTLPNTTGADSCATHRPHKHGLTAKGEGMSFEMMGHGIMTPKGVSEWPAFRNNWMQPLKPPPPSRCE